MRYNERSFIAPNSNNEMLVTMYIINKCCGYDTAENVVKENSRIFFSKVSRKFPEIRISGHRP
jgi:hypothetical protein